MTALLLARTTPGRALLSHGTQQRARAQHIVRPRTTSNSSSRGLLVGAAAAPQQRRLVCMAAAAAAAGPASLAAEAVVQKQLEAYNSRDLNAFMALLSEDCVAIDALTGTVLGQGAAALRERYAARFQTEVHSELLGRLCLGDVVVDREIITGLPDGAAADCLATYHVADGKIKRMEFVWQPRP